MTIAGTSSCARQVGRSLRFAVVLGMLVPGVVAVTVSPARADTFCDLSPTSAGIGIDFAQPTAQIRSSATAQLPFFRGVAKLLPSDAPKSVRALYAGDLSVVARAAKVSTAAEVERLARQSFALSTSASGRAAVKWLEGRCRVPDTIDVVTIGPDNKATKATSPTTGPPNPARVATPPTSTAGGPFDPCSIIPAQLAATALGADPGPGDSTSTRTGGQCSYGTDAGGLIVTIVRGPLALGKTAKDAVLSANTVALASKARDTKGDLVYNTLPGIGDGAFVIGTGASPDKAFTSASLTFYKGDSWVTLLLSYTPAVRDPVTQITSLAKSVAPLVSR